MKQLKEESLKILRDGITAEALACKKCDAYSGLATDQCVKSLFSDMAQHHKQNFFNLLNYLRAQS
ncbi:MAG: hypothetical protein KIG36_00655 [Eubacteriales bacterium]|nr:hypothetical protein [Eubacteriales bacterium]